MTTRHPSIELENRIVLAQARELRQVLETFNLRVQALSKDAETARHQVMLVRDTRKFEDQISNILHGSRAKEIRDSEESSMAANPPNPAFDESPSRKSKPKPQLSAEELFKLAQIAVDKEAVNARRKYEQRREELLQQLKAMREGELSAEEKPEIIAQLDAVEREYSSIWRRLESGARGAEILAEIEAKASKQKRRRRHQPKKYKPLKTQIKKKASVTDFERAVRKLKADERAAQARIRDDNFFRSLVYLHPAKTNSMKDDRIYMSAGVPNPRGKKK
ncbi:hypothetical protein [uncultured Corynebacterium sp.]|uniref:hypothetical protein n=1 Tax=uncultured Corynebacterium sp. TaxID=159447 RepID=UPI0026021BF3|nr:hypothetical protein [uncultured Corynebacterium sp.]